MSISLLFNACLNSGREFIVFSWKPIGYIDADIFLIYESGYLNYQTENYQNFNFFYSFKIFNPVKNSLAQFLSYKCNFHT